MVFYIESQVQEDLKVVHFGENKNLNFFHLTKLEFQCTYTIVSGGVNKGGWRMSVKKVGVMIAILMLPALLTAKTPVPVGVVEPEIVGFVRSPGPDTCISFHEPDLYYYPEDYQIEYEATLAECEFDGPRWVKAITILWFNYGTDTLEKEVELWLWPPGAVPDCNNALLALQTTTLAIPPGEAWLVQYDVYEFNIPFQYKMWFGHYEVTAGPPTSVFDIVYDLEQDYDETYLNLWSFDCIDWYVDYDHYQFLILDTIPPTAVEENTLTESHGLNLTITGPGVISFTLPANSKIDLRIYDVKGSLVDEIIGTYAAGKHTFTWNKGASGVYFVNLRAGSLVETQKFVLMK